MIKSSIVLMSLEPVPIGFVHRNLSATKQHHHSSSSRDRRHIQLAIFDLLHHGLALASVAVGSYILWVLLVDGSVGRICSLYQLCILSCRYHQLVFVIVLSE